MLNNVDCPGQDVGAEITLTLSVCWQEQSTGLSALHLPCALIVREPKYFIFPEWPADSVTELIAPQFGFLGNEEVRSVQLVIAHKLEYVAMKSVCT